MITFPPHTTLMPLWFSKRPPVCPSGVRLTEISKRSWNYFWMWRVVIVLTKANLWHEGELAQLVERVLSMHEVAGSIPAFSIARLTSWPSGLRRYVQVVVLVGVGSNPTDVIHFTHTTPRNINHQWKVAVPFIQTIFMCNIYITAQTKNMVQSIKMDI